MHCDCYQHRGRVTLVAMSTCSNVKWRSIRRCSPPKCSSSSPNKSPCRSLVEGFGKGITEMTTDGRFDAMLTDAQKAYANQAPKP